MEEFIVNNNLFYEYAVNHNALYDSNQVTFGTLYSNQPDFDMYNNIEYKSNYSKDINNSMINLEDTQHRDIIENESSDCIRRCTLVCEHYRKPDATKSKDSKKKTTSKHVGYIWQINLSCLEKDNPHKMESLEFTTNMVRDVEFYVRKMNCSSQQIHKALEKKYSVKVYMPVLHRALTDNETKKAHIWILQQIKKATLEA
ncbi:43785_t:CDS:2, partial [Gigaspora margarita]